jgi:uncharacterized HAD superfamily protein
MRIAVDINGVLIDNMENFVDLYNKLHKTQYEKKDVTNWEFYHDWGFSDKEFFELFYKTYDNMNSIKFIDHNAPKIMKKLNKIHDVYLLSALNSLYESLLIEKLNYHNIQKGIHYKEVIIVPDRPWDLKAKHEFDIYIDDNPNLIEPIKGLNRYLLLYDQPWNQDCIAEKNIFRVHNWKQIFKIINQLSV